MIQAIGAPSNTEAWVTERLQRGEKITGFGHAVYRADDPRSVLLRTLVVEVAPDVGGIEIVERQDLATQRSLHGSRAHSGWLDSGPWLRRRFPN